MPHSILCANPQGTFFRNASFFPWNDMIFLYVSNLHHQWRKLGPGNEKKLEIDLSSSFWKMMLRGKVDTETFCMTFCPNYSADLVNSARDGLSIFYDEEIVNHGSCKYELFLSQPGFYSSCPLRVSLLGTRPRGNSETLASYHLNICLSSGKTYSSGINSPLKHLKIPLKIWFFFFFFF